MAARKPSYLAQGRPDQHSGPSAPPFSDKGSPVASAQQSPVQTGAAHYQQSAPPPPPQPYDRQGPAGHYQSFPSWETNVPTNAGPGPAAIASPQYRALTGGVPAGPHVPGVWVQQYAGIDNYGLVRNSFGGIYAGPPTQTLAWQAQDGWQYAIYSDYAIKVLRSQAHGTTPANAANGVVFPVGSKENFAIIKQWFDEIALHPVGTSTNVFMQQAAAASKKAASGTGLVGALVGAVSDMVSVVTGGSSSASNIPAPPKPPSETAPAVPPQYAPGPDGSMTLVPGTGGAPKSTARKMAPYVGAGLLAVLAAGGAYYYFSAPPKKNPRRNGPGLDNSESDADNDLDQENA